MKAFSIDNLKNLITSLCEPHNVRPYYVTEPLSTIDIDSLFAVDMRYLEYRGGCTFRIMFLQDHAHWEEFVTQRVTLTIQHYILNQEKEYNESIIN